MSLAPPTTMTRRPVVAAAVPEEADKRFYQRFELPLSGRFMTENKLEHTCTVLNISIGGVGLSVPRDVAAQVTVGEKIIAYIDQIGGLEGPVLRTWDDGFAFKINATQHKREKLAAQMTWLLNEAELKGAAARQHERVHVGNRSSTLTVNSGVSLPVLILDVSVSGASLACKQRPDIGAEVWLARRRARVVRHHVEGVGIQFMEVLDVPTLQAYFV